MADPFVGEVKLISFTYAPRGWAFCDGALLPINQNQALFSLLGTAYGGNGVNNFGLPNLQGRVAVHQSQGYVMGQAAGEAAHTLTLQEMPVPHAHTAQGTSAQGTSFIPQGQVLANPGLNLYATPNPPQPVAAGTVSGVGGAPHENMSPYLPVTFCVALVGVFPSRN
jgi:microcystin-dependent protein